jgi:hypothetical protein
MEEIATLALLFLSAWGGKSLVGYHFGWETCGCCKRKFSEHNGNPPSTQKKQHKQYNDEILIDP